MNWWSKCCIQRVTIELFIDRVAKFVVLFAIRSTYVLSMFSNYNFSKQNQNNRATNISTDDSLFNHAKYTGEHAQSKSTFVSIKAQSNLIYELYKHVIDGTKITPINMINTIHTFWSQQMHFKCQFSIDLMTILFVCLLLVTRSI